MGKIGLRYGLDPKRTQPASHISAIIENKNLQLIAVCDFDKNSRDLFLAKYGNIADVYDDYRKLIAELNMKKISFDILVIATPDFTHDKILEYIIKKLDISNKSTIIFCEKPLTVDFKSAKRLETLLKNKKMNIVVNHSRRWSKIWQEAYKLTKNIGRISHAAFYFSLSPENKEFSQIRDGIHIADLMVWFKIGKKTSVNRLQLPYFVYDFHLWGSKGKIEVLAWGKTLNYFKSEESKRFEGFRELELVFSKKIRESYLVNAYEEFVEFLQGRKKKLSTNFNDASEALRIFEKYVYEKNSSQDKSKGR